MIPSDLALFDELFDWIATHGIAWLLTSGVRIVLIVIISLAAYKFLRVSIQYTINRLQELDGVEDSEFDKRVETILSVIKRTAITLIVTMALLMILREIGADIRPLLASVGIVGLALGLGAQTLVRDVIGGLFILLEDQYKVGDVIEVGSRIGTVEKMTLRATRIRDFRGALHILPNSEIRIVANRTRDWSRAIIDIGITYEDDVDLAIETLQEIGDELSDNDLVGPMLLEPAVVMGIEDLADWQIKLRLAVKTLPNQQITVQRYLRRRIQEIFAKKGIALATPRHEVALLYPAPTHPDYGLTELKRE